MADTSAFNPADLAKIFNIISAIVKFSEQNPTALQDVVKFASIVEQLIAAFNAPKA